MKSIYKLVLKEMESVDQTLQCTDFNGSVVVTHQDGSVFKLNNAIGSVRRIDNFDILMVWTEHCGYFSFFVDDLESYKINKHETQYQS